jgi:hypothetical protein
MDSSVYVPLFSGFVGAIIGALATIATVWIQLHYQSRRELLHQAAQMAMDEFKVQIDVAQKNKKGEGVLPVSVWCHYYAEILKAMERGDFNAETLKGILERNAAMVKVAEEATRLRRQT